MTFPWNGPHGGASYVKNTITAASLVILSSGFVSIVKSWSTAKTGVAHGTVVIVTRPTLLVIEIVFIISGRWSG